MDARCIEALRCKHVAIGTDSYPKYRDACSRTFLESYREYVRKVRREMNELTPSSRGWWKLANSLLTKSSTTENIPPLQRNDDSWTVSSAEKAHELAITFREKAILPSAEDNSYSTIADFHGTPMHGFLRLRIRLVAKLLQSLDDHSGTGPDRIPA
eukprot:8476047-Karenia_brevis.AAC.1